MKDSGGREVIRKLPQSSLRVRRVEQEVQTGGKDKGARSKKEQEAKRNEKRE